MHLYLELDNESLLSPTQNIQAPTHTLSVSLSLSLFQHTHSAGYLSGNGKFFAKRFLLAAVKLIQHHTKAFTRCKKTFNYIKKTKMN